MFSAAVVRPPASRENSTASTWMVVVGRSSNSSTNPASPVHRHPQRALQRPGQLERDATSVGRPGELAHDAAKRRRDFGQRVLGRCARHLFIGRPHADRIADVLLVHPTVENPDPHEPAVGVRPHRRGGGLVSGLLVHRQQRLAPLRGDGPKPVEHRGGRLVVQVPDLASFIAASSLCTCGSAFTSQSGVGVGTPIRNDSVPMLCATTSCTRHPGSAVAAAHCSSDKPASSSSMSSHEPNSPSSTSRMSS